MDSTADELAGIVDLFGGLTRAELGEGLAELAFRQGEEYDSDAHAPAIEAAIESYHLVPVEYDGSDEQLFVVGPAAFPELPPDGRDLLHILDIDPREIDRSTAAGGAMAAFERDAATAVEAGDNERIERLIDLSYELEAWGSLDLSPVRERLDDALDGGG